MKKIIFLLAFVVIVLSSCSENYSNGERIGVITQFSETGMIFKTWEGHLNVTQTGMNSSVPFDFSIDRDVRRDDLVQRLDSAAEFGWKVKIVYHEVRGWNWFANRGETDHFVKEVQVLEKNFGNAFNGNSAGRSGHVIDTIYVVIDKTK